MCSETKPTIENKTFIKCRVNSILFLYQRPAVKCADIIFQNKVQEYTTTRNNQVTLKNNEI